METSLIVSGYGGQGVLFVGMAISKGAMEEGKYVTWLPAYGAEMRGGTANCTVIIADEEVASPFQQNPKYVIALNSQSVERFEEKIRPGGTMIINSSLYKGKQKRTDINYIFIPANEIAQKIGEIKCANMVMLSALVAKTKIIRLESLKKVLKTVFTASKAKFLEINEKAIAMGAEYVRVLVKA